MNDHPRYTSESFVPLPKFRRNYPAENWRSRCEEFSNTSSYIPPWKTRTYKCGVKGLHEEMVDFYNMMKPSEEESDIRLKVVEHITKIIHSLWPLAQVEVFGSFRTGLYLPSSDIDMVVIGEWRNLPLNTLSEALERNGIQRNDINIIAHASVPIVKILHTPSQIKVDISFNVRNGVKGVKLIKKWIKEYPVIPPLVFALKQFLVDRDLNEVYSGGMGSYCLTLLLLSFLQGFHKAKNLPSLNLGTVLLEFFEHYGVNFNHETVAIHLQNGGRYEQKMERENNLSVIDPINGKNVAKGTYLFSQVQKSFRNAYYLLSNTVLNSNKHQKPEISYLCHIFRIDDFDSRNWLHKNYNTVSSRLCNLLQNIK